MDNKALRVRIYPNKTQQKKIDTIINCCRFVRNHMIERNRKAYDRRKEHLNYISMQNLLPVMKKYLPVVGNYYLERDVKAMVNEWKKERALLEARAGIDKEIGRRTEMLAGEHRKKIEAGYASREAELAKREEGLKEKDREVSRKLRNVLILKEKLEDKDYQRRYELLSDELTKKKAEIDNSHDMRVELYLKANKEAEAIRSKAKEDAERILSEAQAEAQRHVLKMQLLKEHYPKINEKLDQAVKDCGKKLKSSLRAKISQIENSNEIH